MGTQPIAGNSPRIVTFLILAVLAIKAVFLILDPTVRLFMGDSASYLHAAWAAWVPADRSYTYPLFIRLLAVPAHSLVPLLLAQTFLGACTALLVYRMLQGAFAVDAPVAAIAAVLFAAGPEQLFYERMVMAETISLFALACMLASGLAYLRKGNPAWLLGMTLAGVMAISYRMSLLPVVLGFALLPPMIRLLTNRHRGKRAIVVGLVHVLVAATLTIGAHSAYKSWVGYLGDGKPGYAINAGMLRLGLVLPLVKQEDLDGLGLPDDFLDSLPPGWNDRGNREAALWSDDGVIARLRAQLGDEGMTRVARKLSIRAMRRDPAGLARLGWLTLGDYFSAPVVAHRMRDDLGERSPSAKASQTLRERFGYESDGVYERRTLTHVYFGACGPWLTLCLFALPLFGLLNAGLGWSARNAAMLLLGLTSVGMFLGHALFSSIVSFRYLHAFPMAVLLDAGALAAWVHQSRSGRTMSVDPEFRGQEID